MGSTTTASGDFSATMGGRTTAKSYSETVIGSYNTDYSPVSTNGWNLSDRLFVVGNGTSSASKSDALVILKNGNVGIGTATPNAPLQFANSVSNRKVVLYEAANNDHQFNGFGLNPGMLRFQVNNTGDDFGYYAGTSSTTSNEVMRIKGNGNVGIGTTTPAAKLDVNGYTKLGELSPNIKTKLLTGTTASTEGNAAGVATGIDATKILAINIFVTQGTGLLIPPSFTNSAGYEYQYTISSGILALLNKAANSFAILSKPFTAFITYKE